MNEKLVVYQTESGSIMLHTDSDKETIWANQAQMADIFGVNTQAITKHLKNIYKEWELMQESTCSKMEQVQNENGRTVKRKVLVYNLDAIISVGYRISSVSGTKFRRWATTTLREHITQGYTINPARIEKNYEQFLKAVEDVKKMLPTFWTRPSRLW